MGMKAPVVSTAVSTAASSNGSALKRGDLIQWTAHGVDQFPEPKPITGISDCGGFCFVEGSATGIPVDQVAVMPTRPPDLGARPPGWPEGKSWQYCSGDGKKPAAEAQPASNGNGRHDEPHEIGALARWGPWNQRSKELAVCYEKHWVIRRDCFGQYYTDQVGKVCQVTRKEVPLTLGILLRHCRARKTEEVIGLHTTGFVAVDGVPRGGVSVCVLLCIDIDHHGDGRAPEANLRAALAWFGILAGLGFHPLLIDSNGRGGYRLYVIFDQQILAKHARQLGRWLVRDWADYGLAECPEVFPKQDEISGPGGSTPFGNWLRLPGRHHKRDHWSTVWDGTEFVGGDDAIDAILDRTGDSPQLIPAEALEFERDRKTERAERDARRAPRSSSRGMRPSRKRRSDGSARGRKTSRGASSSATMTTGSRSASRCTSWGTSAFSSGPNGRASARPSSMRKSAPTSGRR